MIQEIIIDGVASYKTPVTVTGLKKINLFYGLNGTGKSTLAQYLRECHEPSERFSKSSIKRLHEEDPFEMLVYNQDFVHQNFFESSQQKGIFTLDKANAEAMTAISKAREAIKLLENERKPLVEELERLKNKSEDLKNNNAEFMWEAKQSHEKTALKECMAGFLSPKLKFADKIITTTPSETAKEDVPSALLRLQSDLVELNTANIQKKSLHGLLNSAVSEFETNPIWQEKIVGSKDSYLSELIARLNHADWVTQGINDYLPHTDDCPFCKREMNEEIKGKIKNYIDGTYQSKLTSIGQLKKSYFEKAQILEEKLKQYKADTVLSKDKNLLAHIERLQNTLKNNSLLIEKKSKEASLPIELGTTMETAKEIDKIIQAENSAIEIFNQKIDNRHQAIVEIKKEFWQLLRKQYDAEIVSFKEKKDSCQTEMNSVIEKGKAVREKIDAQKAIILENQKHTKNVETAVNRINGRLKSFGLEGFEIKKTNASEDDEDAFFYKIERDSPSGSTAEFKTLSEGEKTLITFLYFVELCLGVEDADKDGHASSRIVVIDDPISSLSFNLVFDIATLVREVFLTSASAYKQVFILTHHLYFLHELFGGVKPELPKETSLFRIIKSGKTQITPATRAEVKNNYECYWQVIKDVKNNRASSAILPNAMRNILEHYFSFIHGEDKFSAAISKLSREKDDQTFWSFQRFTARGSHLDGINLTDMGEIDVSKFLTYFRLVFIETGYEAHYNSMMGDDAQLSLGVVSENAKKAA